MNEVIDLTGEEPEEDWMSFSCQGRAVDVPDSDTDEEVTVVKVFSFISDDFDMGQDLVSNGYRKGGLLTQKGDEFYRIFYGSPEDCGEYLSRTENNEAEAYDPDEHEERKIEESEEENFEIPKPNQNNVQVNSPISSVIEKNEYQSNTVAGVEMCIDNAGVYQQRNPEEGSFGHVDECEENDPNNENDEAESQNMNGHHESSEIQFMDLNIPDTVVSCSGTRRDDRPGGTADMEQASVHQGTQRCDKVSKKKSKYGKGAVKAEFSCYMCLFTAGTIVNVIRHLQDHHKQDFSRYEVVTQFPAKSKKQRNKYCIFPSSKGQKSCHRTNIFKSKLVKTNIIIPKNKVVISNKDKISSKMDNMPECCSTGQSSEMSKPNIPIESHKNETLPHPSNLKTPNSQNDGNCSTFTSHNEGDCSNVPRLIHNPAEEVPDNSICVRTHRELVSQVMDKSVVDSAEIRPHLGRNCGSISQVTDSAVEEPAENSVYLCSFCGSISQRRVGRVVEPAENSAHLCGYCGIISQETDSAVEEPAENSAHLGWDYDSISQVKDSAEEEPAENSAHLGWDWGSISQRRDSRVVEPAENSAHLCSLCGSFSQVRDSAKEEPTDNSVHLCSCCGSFSQVRESAVEEPTDNSVIRADGASYIKDFEFLDLVDIYENRGSGTEDNEFILNESSLKECPPILPEFEEVTDLPDETVKGLACFFCSFVTNDSEVFQIHNQQVHRWENLYGEESQAETQLNADQLKAFPCWFCPFKTTLHEKFIEHTVRYHPLETMCESVPKDIAAAGSENIKFSQCQEGTSDCDSPLNSDPFRVLREFSPRNDIPHPLPETVCPRESSREDTDTSVPQEHPCLDDILEPLPANVCPRASSREDTDTSVPQEHPYLEDILEPLPVNAFLRRSSLEKTNTCVPQEPPCLDDILDHVVVNGSLGGSLGEDVSLDNGTGVPKPTCILQGVLKPRLVNVNSRAALEEHPTESESYHKTPYLHKVHQPLPLFKHLTESVQEVSSDFDSCHEDARQIPLLQRVQQPSNIVNKYLHNHETCSHHEITPDEDELNVRLDGKSSSKASNNSCQILQGSSLVVTCLESSEIGITGTKSVQLVKGITRNVVCSGNKCSEMKENLETIIMVSENEQTPRRPKQRVPSDSNSSPEDEQTPKRLKQSEHSDRNLSPEDEQTPKRLKQRVPSDSDLSPEDEQTPKRLKQRVPSDRDLSPEDVIELFKDVNEYTRVHPIQDFASTKRPRGPRSSKFRTVKRRLFSNCKALTSKVSHARIKGRFKQDLTWDSNHSKKQPYSHHKYKKQSGAVTASLNQGIVFNGSPEKSDVGQQHGPTTQKIGRNEQQVITNTIWSHLDTENKLRKKRGRPRKNRSPEHNLNVTRTVSLTPKLKKRGRPPKPKMLCSRQMRPGDGCYGKCSFFIESLHKAKKRGRASKVKMPCNRSKVKTDADSSRTGSEIFTSRQKTRETTLPKTTNSGRWPPDQLVDWSYRYVSEMSEKQASVFLGTSKDVLCVMMDMLPLVDLGTRCDDRAVGNGS